MVGTWEELFYNSLSQAGKLGTGQVPNAAMYAEAQAYTKLVLDELDGEGLALPVMDIDISFNTVAGQFVYVLGTGPNLTPDNPIRPETVLTARLELQGGSLPVYQILAPMAFKNYRQQQTPATQSTPFQYSINPKWPQMDFYLFPTPSQTWEIDLTAKVRWIDIVGNPACQPCDIAQLNSGFTNALTCLVALRLAEKDRLDTPVLHNKAMQGKYFMMTQVWGQVPDLDTSVPSAFPWDLVTAGRNPV